MKHVHVVSFQNPDPPSYGGVIDVYFLLAELKSAGVKVTLHTYVYGNRASVPDSLRALVDEVVTYRRKTNILAQLSRLPYIVKSRTDKRLVENLLADDDPIIFEGVHTAASLDDPRLAARVKVLRAHNVEHQYYRGLSDASGLLKKIYFRIEAVRLKRFENRLRNADLIAALSESDRAWFAERYSADKCILVPPFFDSESFAGDGVAKESFVLFNGNLSVAENDKVARSIVSEVAPLLRSVNFIIAGSSPSRELLHLTGAAPNVELRQNPDDAEMRRLITTAKVALLFTFQASGVKLKLLSALMSGAQIVANGKMVEGTPFRDHVNLAETPEQMARMITAALADRLPASPPFPESYLPVTSCHRLVAAIDDLAAKRRSNK